jgi:hypothetical protein
MIFNATSRFRWVFCQLEALRHCLAPRVRHMLKELPETLDETYERILRDINKANRDHAHRLLECLTVAVRPLRVAELAEVLAVDLGTAYRGGTSKLNTDWRWEDQQEAVLSTCSSLISIVDEKRVSNCTIFTLLCKGVPHFVADCRFKCRCIAFSHSPRTGTHDPCQGMPGRTAAVG